MATVQRFEDLEIWKEARILALEIFEITHSADFPRDYGYINQINNAAGSIMDNIAEGFERSGRFEFINSLGYSKGSAGEVRSQLHRGKDRKYYSDETYTILLEKVERLSKKIGSFINYLNRNEVRGTRFKDRSNNLKP